jgi:hypothetical protein
MASPEHKGAHAGWQHRACACSCIERDVQPEARADQKAERWNAGNRSHTTVDANCGIARSLLLSVGYRDDVAVLADGLAGDLCSSVSLEA